MKSSKVTAATNDLTNSSEQEVVDANKVQRNRESPDEERDDRSSPSPSSLSSSSSGVMQTPIDLSPALLLPGRLVNQDAAPVATLRLPGEANQPEGSGDLASSDSEELTSLMAEADSVDKKNDAEFQAYVGNRYLEVNQPALALKCYRRAIKLRPESTVYHNAGYCFYAIGAIKQAKTCFEQVIKYSPSSGIHIKYALFLYQQGEYQGAIEHIRASEDYENSKFSYNSFEQSIIAPLLQMLLNNNECEWIDLTTDELGVYLTYECYHKLGQSDSVPGLLFSLGQFCGHTSHQRLTKLYLHLLSSYLPPMKTCLEDLTAAQRVAWEAAKRLEDQVYAIDSSTESLAIDREKIPSLVKAWDKFIATLIENLDENLDENQAEFNLPFIYYSFRRHIENNLPSAYCMCCLKKAKKIAESHWISKSLWDYFYGKSSYFVFPGQNKIYSAAKLTLKLFCTGNEKNCEQKLSKNGETDFANNFLPFINRLRKAIETSSQETLNLKYGPWLFYNIVSLVFRLMLVDLEHNASHLVKCLPDASLYHGNILNYWYLFIICRRILLNQKPEDAEKLRIEMYFSRENISSAETESRLVNIVLYGPNPWIIFGMAGVYFVVAQSFNFSKDLFLPSEGRTYQQTILFDGGEIVCDVSKINNNLPKNLIHGIQKYLEKKANDFSNFNHNLVSEKLNKMFAKGKNSCDLTPRLNNDFPFSEKYAKQLPSGIDVSHGHSGESNVLQYNPSTYFLLSDASTGQMKSWLLLNHQLKYFLVVFAVNGEDNSAFMATAFQFDHRGITREALKNLNEEQIDNDVQLNDLFKFDLKPTHDNDSSVAIIKDSDTQEELDIKKFVHLSIALLSQNYFDRSGKTNLNPADFESATSKGSKETRNSRSAPKNRTTPRAGNSSSSSSSSSSFASSSSPSALAPPTEQFSFEAANSELSSNAASSSSSVPLPPSLGIFSVPRSSSSSGISEAKQTSGMGMLRRASC